MDQSLWPAWLRDAQAKQSGGQAVSSHADALSNGGSSGSATAKRSIWDEKQDVAPPNFFTAMSSSGGKGPKKKSWAERQGALEDATPGQGYKQSKGSSTGSNFGASTTAKGTWKVSAPKVSPNQKNNSEFAAIWAPMFASMFGANVGASNASNFAANFGASNFGAPNAGASQGGKRKWHGLPLSTGLPKRQKAVTFSESKNLPSPLTTFLEIDALPEWVHLSLAENQWETPMPIQSKAIPVLLTGSDLIGIAKTGSGKTGAFLIPAIVHILKKPKLNRLNPGPLVLVLAPTRELGVQIHDEAEKLLKYSWTSNPTGGIGSAVFYGGGKKGEQLLQFSQCDGFSHIVCSTPGRLSDFVRTGSLTLHNVSYVVLDEADRLLDDGFAEEIFDLVGRTNPKRQIGFYSATWPVAVQAFAERLMGSTAARVRAGAGDIDEDDDDDWEEDGKAPTARSTIVQEVVVIDPTDTPSAQSLASVKKRTILENHLRTVLQNEENKILVFVNSKVLAGDLAAKLCEEGFSADAMHGDRPQETRLKVLKSFREGWTRLLIATDVSSRGLDIPAVTHIVVWEMGGIQDYVHRVGRTGRGVNGAGHALIFFEYWPKFPNLAGELIGALERVNQPVPEDLRRIAKEVEEGKRPIHEEAWWKKNSKKSWTPYW